MNVFISKTDEQAVEKIGKDKECRQYVKARLMNIVFIAIMAIAFISYNVISLYTNGGDAMWLNLVFDILIGLVIIIDVCIALKEVMKITKIEEDEVKKENKQ